MITESLLILVLTMLWRIIRLEKDIKEINAVLVEIAKFTDDIIDEK